MVEETTAISLTLTNDAAELTRQVDVFKVATGDTAGNIVKIPTSQTASQNASQNTTDGRPLHRQASANR